MEHSRTDNVIPGVEEQGKINFGLRAHDLGKFAADEMAARVSDLGFTHIQLALKKALLGFTDDPPLNPGLIRNIARSFNSRGVDISILGCYINPVHPEPLLREKGIQRFEEHLRVCRDLGCSIVGTETGSVLANNSWSDANASSEIFSQFAGVVERLIFTAERFGVFVGIEGVAEKNVIHNLDAMSELLIRIDSPNLGVIYDPVNFLSSRDCDHYKDHIDEAFGRFGNRIIAVHAKDFRTEDGKKIGTLPAGTGELDYAWFLQRLNEEYPGIHVLLENNSADSLPETIKFFSGLGYQI